MTIYNLRTYAIQVIQGHKSPIKVSEVNRKSFTLSFRPIGETKMRFMDSGFLIFPDKKCSVEILDTGKGFSIGVKGTRKTLNHSYNEYKTVKALIATLVTTLNK